MDIAENRPKLGHIIQNKARQIVQKTYWPRVSNAGGCARALTFQARGTSGRSSGGRMPVLLSDGALHEASTIQWLENGGQKVIMTQYGLDVAEIPGETDVPRHCELCDRDIPGNILHGHIDGVVDDGNRYYLFEHKGLGDYGYELLSKEFPQGYITQCCAYLKGLQNAGFDITSALLLCKNKNTSDYRQIYIEYDALTDIARAENEWNGLVDIFSEVVSGLVQLHSTVAECRPGEANLPPRPYDQEDFHCTNCAFFEPCWGNERTEVTARRSGVSVSRESALGRAIHALVEAREAKSEILEQEKQAKRKINTILAEQDMRSGKTEDYSFWLSPFEKKYLDENAIPLEALEKARRSMYFQSIKIKKI